MLTIKIILLLLPAVAYCGISIRISPGKTEADTVVKLSGSDKALISDKERKTFKLDNDSLNKAVKAWLGNTCTDIYVNPPTKFGDVYDKYHWDLVERTLKPVGYKIIGISPRPDAVITAEYINSHAALPVQYSTTINKELEEEVSHGWSTSGELSVGQEINYSVSAGAATVGGSTSMSYTAGWGKEGSKARKVTLGTTSTVQVLVPVGQKALATISTESATLEVEIYYEATIYGDVFCNYANKYEGQHFYAHPISILQDYGHLPVKVNSTERISVGFYSNTKVELS